MIQYKIDVLFELKNKGFTTFRIRKEHLLSEKTLQNLRNNSGINFDSLNTLCKLLQCQPGDIIEFIDDSAE